MNSKDISKMFYEPLIKGLLRAFKIVWDTNEFKSAVIGYQY